MKILSALRMALPAALAAAGGIAIAATPTVDGTRDASYGTTPLTSQKASVIDITLASLSGSAQSNNSNLGGVVSFAGSTFSFPAPDSDPAAVTTGFELAVDLNELGWDGSSPIKIAGWLIKDGTGVTITNQVIGGLPANSQNVGDATVADLSAITGNQYITVSTVNNTAATVDGTLDASYGAPLFVNTLATTLTNATVVTQDTSNGSEIDAVYAYRSSTRLYLFMSGNLRTQYDKIALWFDVKSGGQNPVIVGNNGADFGIVNNHAGLKFDTAFVPDYFIDYTGGPGGDHYLNYVVLPTIAGGGGGYTQGNKPTPLGTGVGERRVLAFPGEPTTNGQAAPPNGGSMEAAFNNLNTGGVAGALANPNPWTTPPGSNPATVTTGVEMKVPLADTGWVSGVTSIKVGGFILGFNWDYLSNQVIGSVPATQDSYGFPANAVDFSSTANAGAQFVTYSVPSNLFAANLVIDGTKDASGYTSVWVNNTPANSGNPTSFGDNTATDPNAANGSEIDALYMRAGLDSSNGNAPTLWIFAAGNIHDNNKLCIFLDTKAGGQQTLQTSNFTFGLQNLNGLKFDAGFEPDYMVAYASGFDSNTSTSSHTMYAAQLPTGGGGYGGIVATSLKTNTTTVLSGTFKAKNGFSNNTDSTAYNANGSELDNVFAQLGNNPNTGNPELFLHIGGNLEPNSNKLEIFFDVLSGVGQNTLIYDDPSDGYTGNPDADNPSGVAGSGALNRMGGPYLVPGSSPPVTQPGLTFETGFTADYYVYLTNNNVSLVNQTSDIFGGWARLKGVPTAGDPGAARYWGKTNQFALGQFDGGDLLTNEEALACIDNSNVGGVAGGSNSYTTPTSDPATVTKGMEIGIPIADLAPWNGTTPIKMMIFINGQNHDFVSQQSLQSMCKDADLGEPRNVNFQSISGVQTITLNYDSSTHRYTNSSTAPLTCAAPCPGDVNGDRIVNTLDLGILLGSFGASGSNLPGDLNGDGLVNTVDLGTMLSRFGSTCP